MKWILASLAIPALAAGVLIGGLLRRAVDAPTLQGRRTRPPALEAAWRAWERGLVPQTLDRLADLGATLEGEDAAEAALLEALAQGDERALRRLLREHPTSRAAAHARFEIFRLTAPGARRDAMRRDLGRRYPGAWTLIDGGGS